MCIRDRFGLDFDSRLYMGRDVFSDAEPFVLLRDHSWITENAMYYAPSDELIMLQGDELSPEEVEERNQDVSNRFRASAWVLDQDYWRYLFGDNLPPDGENCCLLYTSRNACGKNRVALKWGRFQICHCEERSVLGSPTGRAVTEGD